MVDDKIRWNCRAPILAFGEFMLITDNRIRNGWVLSATPKKTIVASVTEETEEKGKKKTRTRRATTRGRKKSTAELQDDDTKLSTIGSISEQEVSDLEASIDNSEKPKRRARRKGIQQC